MPDKELFGLLSAIVLFVLCILQNVELGWATSFRNSNWIRGVRLFVRGSNLLTVSGVKYIDPESVSAGVTTDPLYRTFTGGVKLNF